MSATLPRISRTVIANIPHHITQRGNRRKPMFFIDEDRKVYIEQLTECCQKHHHIQILAYCLMTNHVHLIAIPEDKSITTDTVHWKQLENIIDWSGWLNDSEDKKQLNIVRRNIQKNLPCGTDASQRVRKIPDRRCN